MRTTTLRYVLLTFLLSLGLTACATIPGSVPDSTTAEKVDEQTSSPPSDEEVCVIDPLLDPARDAAQDDEASVPDDAILVEEALLPPAVVCETEPITLTPEEQQALASEPEIRFDLDHQETEEVQLYFKLYTHKYRKTFARWLKRSEPYLPYIRKYFTEQGIPQDLVFLPFAESGFNSMAYSRAGAAGMWQFIPGTGRRYGLDVDWWVDERRDPYRATRAAAAYLKKLHDQFGDWYLALAGYNAGEGKVAWAIKRSGCEDYFDIASSRSYFKQETRHYVPKLLAILKIIRNLESLGFEPLNWEAPEEPTMVEVRGGTDLLAMAEACGMSWSEFKNFNPFFRRMVSPPDKTCPVYLPPDKLQVAQSYLESPASRPYAGYKRYKIRSGDSWWKISRRFAVPIAVLKRVNNTNSNLLRPGHSVMIPAPGSSTAVAAADEERWEPSASGVHTVRRGDTLWEIGRRYGVSIQALRRTNNIGSDQILRVGQKLNIPGAGQQTKTHAFAVKKANYVVRRGDTLWEISRRFDINMNTLLAANGLNSGRSLQVGQKLYIPDRTPQAAKNSLAEAKKVHDQLVQYKVRKGDNLWTIARRFGVSASDLQAWNDLPGNARIFPGDSLRVYVP